MKEKLFTVHKKDFTVQTFRSGGHGGQHQNKTDSGVRIIHKASGARGESRNDKSQYRNKRIALKRLTETNKFKLWIHKMAFEITSGKTIEQRVEEAMNIKNLKIEIKSENDKWIKEPSNMSKKIYTPQEATTMLRNNPVLYAEIAHGFPCCNLPIEENCNKCAFKDNEKCPINGKK